MNGHHTPNLSTQAKSPQPQINGAVITTKAAANQSPGDHGSVKATTGLNGISSNHVVSVPTQRSRVDIDALPPEIMSILATIPDDAYVPMSRIIGRTAQQCWKDLIHLINQLVQERLPDPTEVMSRLPPPENQIINDTSDSNRLKKKLMWDFAENHKRILIKMLVLLQWSSKSQENRLTIALNSYLLNLRLAYSTTNTWLADLANMIVARHDACPDIETALQVLAAERVQDLPDLGYVEADAATDRQMLSTLRRLNRVLNIRITNEDSIPIPLNNWTIHDGRITFHVPDEFDLDLSVSSEDVNAPFLMVDIRFNFQPTPMISDAIHEQIGQIANSQLSQEGLIGAYNFLHELTLSQKLKEYHRQALHLVQGLWGANLRVEMLKRTLIIQYWTRRTSSKSWIEIGIYSGRSSQDQPIESIASPYLGLRWMKEGKLVAEHEIHMDLTRLSFEKLLNQVIAQHAKCIFDGIYDHLTVQKLFAQDELALEQNCSLIDPYESSVLVETSRSDAINLSIDPIGGTMVISPANDRTGRLQYELSRSKSLTNDFVSRFSALRCGLAQSRLVSASSNSSWQYLVGRKPTLNQVKEMFGPQTLRAAFFRQQGWSEEWMLAAAFGIDGDLWFLIFEPSASNSGRTVQALPVKHLHNENPLSKEYFEKIAQLSAEIIINQTIDRDLRARGVTTVMSGRYTAEVPSIQFHIPDSEGLDTIAKTASSTPWSSKTTSSRFIHTIHAKLDADEALLKRLAAAISESAIEIVPKKRLLKLRWAVPVGTSAVDAMFAKFHYINNLLSCVKLVHHSRRFKIDTLSVKDITITYFRGRTTTLGIVLLLDTSKSQRKQVQLLPKMKNPHSFVLDSITKVLEEDKVTLSSRFQNVLALLAMTLPLLNCILYLQGAVSTEEVPPEISSIDIQDLRKWLRIHVLKREDFEFAVQIFAANPLAKGDAHAAETPETLLARLEIVQDLRLSGWIIRPSIEEFQSYTRPSFTSPILANRLKDKVFSGRDVKGWLPLDTAARCSYEEPQHVLRGIITTVLDWVKDAVNQKDEPIKASAPTSKQNNPSAANTQQTNRGAAQGNGPSRVMIAAPQQVRQVPPQQQQQRRPGPANQNRNNQQRPQISRDVITLD